jgi:hypothetical protein
LIADFGLSRIVEDITGVAFSQKNGISDSYRWLAPELCVDEGVLSTSSDVYAFGMTALEVSYLSDIRITSLTFRCLPSLSPTNILIPISNTRRKPS